MELFCIDASIFLGMNSNDENIRISCKNFFIENINAEILMNFEQVGLCDHVIWSFPFELQCVYYPFMDLFHSTMPIKRLPYTNHTFAGISDIHNLSLTDKLNIAFAKEHNAIICSLNEDVLENSNARALVILQNERSFLKNLEHSYQESLQLSINMDSVLQHVK